MSQLSFIMIALLIRFTSVQNNMVQTELDFNINFIQGLRKEWRNISLLGKTHEKFDSYSSSVLYNILKAREFDVREIVDEKDKSTFEGVILNLDGLLL